MCPSSLRHIAKLFYFTNLYLYKKMEKQLFDYFVWSRTMNTNKLQYFPKVLKTSIENFKSMR